MFKKESDTASVKKLDDFWDYVLFDSKGNQRKPADAMLQIAIIRISANDKTNWLEQYNKIYPGDTRLNNTNLTILSAKKKLNYTQDENLKSINDETNLIKCVTQIQKFVQEKYASKIENHVSSKGKKIKEGTLFQNNGESKELMVRHDKFKAYIDDFNNKLLDLPSPTDSTIPTTLFLPKVTSVKYNTTISEEAKASMNKASRTKQRNERSGILGTLWRAGHAIKKGIKYPFNSKKRNKKQELLENEKRKRQEEEERLKKERIAAEKAAEDERIRKEEEERLKQEAERKRQEEEERLKKERIAAEKAAEEERKRQEEEEQPEEQPEEEPEEEPKEELIKSDDEEEDDEQENWYNYNKGTNTITVKGTIGNPTEIITSDMVQKIAKKYGLSEANKINLVLKNCVVKKYVFADCKFINNLTIEQDATVKKYGFSEATIENLTIKESVTVKEYGFSEATIGNLTIEQDATVERYSFWGATIKNLTINKGATVNANGFSSATITNLTIEQGATVNAANGFSSATITNLTIEQDATVEKFCFWNATIGKLTINQGATVNANGFWKATIKNLTINKGATVNANGFSEATIGNLTIEQDAKVNANGFSSATITNLTIKEGAKVEKFCFWNATIGKLTINQGATVEGYGFNIATITNLTIKEGAKVEQYGFWRAKITGTAKYGDGNGTNISAETLKNWGVELEN